MLSFKLKTLPPTQDPGGICQPGGHGTLSGPSQEPKLPSPTHIQTMIQIPETGLLISLHALDHSWMMGGSLLQSGLIHF